MAPLLPEIDLDSRLGMKREIERLVELVDALTDGGECSFDHHGGCQAHGYLTLEAGEVCPQAEAQATVAHYQDLTARGEW